MSPINFNSVPSNYRVPFWSTEFAAAGGQPAGENLTILLIGQMLAAGSATPDVPIPLSSPSLLDGLFGQGSMLSAMGKASLAENSNNPTFAIALQDNSAGVAATGSVTIGAAATAAGTLALYIGGEAYQAAVNAGDSPSVIAGNLQAAIAADLDCIVSAAIDGTSAAKIDLTFKHKGLVGNFLDLRFNYNTGDAFPAGVTATIVAMSGGTANPSLTAAISGMGETQYNMIAMPYTDATSLSAMETELESRWEAVRQIDGKLFTGAVGSFGTLATLGQSRNSKQDTIVDIQNSPTPIWIWAADAAAAVAASAQNDPALPLQTVALTQVRAPALADQRTIEERNLLLSDGISSVKVIGGGQVVIERFITTYETNPAGAPDTSYLSLEPLLTLSEIRYQYNNMWATKYSQFKLGQDGVKYGPGQKIMTPKLAKAEILNLFANWEYVGLVQNFDPSGLIVEPNDTDPDRLDVLLDPQLMAQLRFVGTQIAFLL